jgi:hypothetical protein
MTISALPDIALALVLTYLLLSLLATTLNEFISTTLKLRSNNLLAAIQTLIDDREIRRLFYDSGLIRSTDLSAAGKDEQPRPSYIDGRTFASGLLNALGQSGSAFDLNGLKTKVDLLTGGLLKDSLNAVFATAETDRAGIEVGIATWFDSSMERLSGDYVRLMKVISLVVGLLLAAALNVDTLRIAYYVTDHPEYAKTLDATARAAIKASPELQVEKCTETDPAKQAACLGRIMSKQHDLLQQLPIGWKGDVIDDTKDPLVWMLMKVFGLLLTGLAVSIGAPFWFDILQTVMSFRGAGTKAEPEPKKKP